MYVFYEMERRYIDRGIIDADKRRDTSVSFANACKWAALHPDISKNQKEYLFSVRYDTLKEYPDLPIEVTMRIREDLPLINIEA